MRRYFKITEDRKRHKWHKWFAWRPVCAWNSEDTLGIVWLEKVWRTKRGSQSLVRNTYRVIE